MSKHEKYGEWALVTGASSGIGREFARKIIAGGGKCVVVARTNEKLEALASEFGADRTMVVAADMATEQGRAELRDAVTDIDIGLVIHSAGVVHMGSVLDMPSDDARELIDVHVSATVEIASFFGQRLRQRGGGGLILISSGLAHSPVPYVATYAASKAFVLSFGEALAYELRDHNVDVLTVVAGGTKTNMATAIESYLDFSKIYMPMGPPQAVVTSALRNLGRRDTVVPGAMNKIMVGMMRKVMGSGTSKSLLGGMMKKALRTQPA